MRKIRTLLAILLLASCAQAQDVLVYDPLPSNELSWYSGFALLNVTYATEAMWMGMTTAQFSAYDLIFMGASTGSSAPYPTLFATRATWQPAITGRIMVHCVDPGAHGLPGAMTFADDSTAWLLRSGGTALLVGSDIGIRGLDFLDAWGITGCTGFNCFAQDTVVITMPMHPTMINSTPSSLGSWGWTSHNLILTVPPGWLTVGTGPGGEPLFIVNEGGPYCTYTSPTSGAMVSDVVSFVFDADDPQTMLPVSVFFDWSTDAGATWNPATAAAGSPLANPTLGLPVPQMGVQFDWDSTVDGVGLLVPDVVDFRVTVDNGTIRGTCIVDVEVDNVLPIPTCTVTPPPGTSSGDISADVTLLSINTPFVDSTVEYSIDSGVTWLPATATAASPLPNPSAGTVIGAHTFIWDSRIDGVATMGVVPAVLLRVTVTDAISILPGICTSVPFDVDNVQLCGGICGDCNLNMLGPDVLDALAAAQISAGITVPTAVELACCDVNISGVVDVLDALLIAQEAAGILTTLMCA